MEMKNCIVPARTGCHEIWKDVWKFCSRWKNLHLEKNAHVLGADGNYKKVDKRGKELFSSQQYFCEEAVELTKQKEDVHNTRLFIPETHHE